MDAPTPSHTIIIREHKWAELTLKQLKKDASLSGFNWHEPEMPSDFTSWISLIHQVLLDMEKQNPEMLSRFLYRVDLPEKMFIQHPFPSEPMAEAVLKRAFLKVWFKAQFHP